MLAGTLFAALIVEMLSPTTGRQDRLERRLAYRLPTGLIAQDRIQAEVRRRIEDGWGIERDSEGDTLRFEAWI